MTSQSKTTEKECKCEIRIIDLKCVHCGKDCSAEWAKAAKTVDFMMEQARIHLAPYSTAELLEMLKNGVNPLAEVNHD